MAITVKLKNSWIHQDRRYGRSADALRGTAGPAPSRCGSGRAASHGDLPATCGGDATDRGAMTGDGLSHP